MKQGDATTCRRCGAEGHAWQTFTPAFDPHPVILTWTRAGKERSFIVSSAHELAPVCCWCEVSPLEGSHEISTPKGPQHPVDTPVQAERRRLPATRRVAILDDLAQHGCTASGAEWNTDADLEQAYQRWISDGRPRGVTVAVRPVPVPEVASFEIRKPAAPTQPQRPQLSLF